MPAADPFADLIALQELLVACVREAGEVALASFRQPLKTWNKANGSPVSSADLAVDELLHARLTGATPAYGWLSEERADGVGRLDAPRVWIVDPIDGTRAYLAGRADWTISAALIEGSRPILCALYAPVEQSLFLAAVGGGATRNGVQIQATRGRSLTGIKVSGPRRQLDQLGRLVPDLAAGPKVHSVALRLARVAEGSLDVALVSTSARDWDLAAADLLVHEAGGELTTLGGEHLAYNRQDPVHGALIAAGRERQQTLIEVVSSRRRQFA